MSVKEISLEPGFAFFTHRVELEGTQYIFEYRYNQREASYYLEIQDELGNHLLGPIKMVSNWFLLRTHRYVPGLPAGDLICVDLSGSIDVPDLNVLGRDVPLWYVEAADMAENFSG